MLTRQNYLGWRWSAVGRHSFKARRLSLGHRQSFFLQNKAQQQSVRDNHSAVAPSLQSASIETSSSMPPQSFGHKGWVPHPATCCRGVIGRGHTVQMLGCSALPSICCSALQGSGVTVYDRSTLLLLPRLILAMAIVPNEHTNAMV